MSPLLKQTLLPPSILLLLLLVGLACARRRGGIGWWVAVISGLSLYLLATPLGCALLSRQLEIYPALSLSEQSTEQADIIVIIGSDSDQAVEFGGEDVGGLTLARLRYGALLHRRTGLPILLSGGPLANYEPTLSSMMAVSLHDDFGLAPQWLEQRSQDTWENAADSAVILREAHIHSVYVVTHAWHMRRALIAFRAAGLRAVAAPVLTDPQPKLEWRSLIPRVPAWEQSYFALHEWIGCAWYWLRAHS